MNFDTQVEMLVCADNKQAYKIWKELLNISEKCNDLYPYFDKFVDMMDDGILIVKLIILLINGLNILKMKNQSQQDNVLKMWLL